MGRRASTIPTAAGSRQAGRGDGDQADPVREQEEVPPDREQRGTKTSTRIATASTRAGLSPIVTQANSSRVRCASEVVGDDVQLLALRAAIAPNIGMCPWPKPKPGRAA